jgi:small GTP-binding protein
LNQQREPKLIVLKIVLIGDGGVGKTAIRERYLGKGFESQYLLTIGADFATKEAIVNKTPVTYQIWDLAGQERFDGVRGVYYKGAVGALLVYDVTRPDSYHNTPKWVKELWTNNGRGKVPLVLVGNKIDLRKSCDEKINTTQGKSLAKKITRMTSDEGFNCNYVETSAKTGKNISIAFSLLGKNIMGFVKQREHLWQKKNRLVESVTNTQSLRQEQ